MTREGPPTHGLDHTLRILIHARAWRYRPKGSCSTDDCLSIDAEAEHDPCYRRVIEREDEQTEAVGAAGAIRAALSCLGRGAIDPLKSAIRMEKLKPSAL